MYRILIVEEEPIIAYDLSMIVRKAGFEVMGPFDNAADALFDCKEKLPDLALLDIHIKGETDGIELAKKLPFSIIFITSYYDDAILTRVQRINPAAFIVKPFRAKEVIFNVKLALSKSKNAQTIGADSILIKDGGLSVPIALSKISYAKGEDNYTKLVLADKKEHLISQTLKSLQDRLPEDRFVRIHKSFIVNSNYIDGIASNTLQLSGQALPIGRTYKPELMKHMQLV